MPYTTSANNTLCRPFAMYLSKTPPLEHAWNLGWPKNKSSCAVHAAAYTRRRQPTVLCPLLQRAQSVPLCFGNMINDDTKRITDFYRRNRGAHFAMHAMNPLVNSSRFRFFPMKIILHLRSSPSFHGLPVEFAKSMWIAW